MPRVIVLGTSTAVGKTYVTRALCHALRRRGADAIALKPVETGVAPLGGVRSGTTISDAEILAEAGAHPVPLSPYRFEPPLSPHLAAERAGTPLSIEALARWIQSTTSHYATSHARGRTLWTLVETAGGVFSPLTLRESQADLARQLEPAVWILVAPDALGCLHAVAATYRALSLEGRLPDHLLLSAPALPDTSTGTNALELERLGLPRPACVVRRNRPSDLEPLVDLLLRGASADDCPPM